MTTVDPVWINGTTLAKKPLRMGPSHSEAFPWVRATDERLAWPVHLQHAALPGEDFLEEMTME